MSKVPLVLVKSRFCKTLLAVPGYSTSRIQFGNLARKPTRIVHSTVNLANQKLGTKFKYSSTNLRTTDLGRPPCFEFHPAAANARGECRSAEGCAVVQLQS